MNATEKTSFEILNNKFLPALDSISVFIAGIAILYSNYLVFLVVPNERVMGPVQKIFYFHENRKSSAPAP